MFVRTSITGLLMVAASVAQEPNLIPDSPEDRKLAIKAFVTTLQGGQLAERGRAVEALAKYREALEMRKQVYSDRKFPNGHQIIAQSLNNIGVALMGIGQTDAALTHFEQALSIYRRVFLASRFPVGLLEIGTSHNNIAIVQMETGEFEKALVSCDQALQAYRQLYPVAKYPDGYLDIARALNNRGVILSSMGQHDRAVGALEQAVQMFRKLYPQGHPLTADCLNNLANLRESMGEYDKALALVHEAMQMYRKLYPPDKFPVGHPNIAHAFTNLGVVYEGMNQFEKALRAHEMSLEMRRWLYPKREYPQGHSSIAISLNNIGSAYSVLNRLDKALSISEEAHQMALQIYVPERYPDGHANLANSFHNVGLDLAAAGQSNNAVTYLDRGMKMTSNLLRREMSTASESAVYDLLAALPQLRRVYMAATRIAKSNSGEVYRVLWPERSMAMRALELRQTRARSGGTATAQLFEQLAINRREVEQWLLDESVDAKQRDAKLRQLADHRDQLERQILHAVPRRNRWRELDDLLPSDLQRTLPAGTVFLDFITYELSGLSIANKVFPVEGYAAFIVANGRPISRVDISEPPAIKSAIAAWRSAIDQQKDARGVGAGEIAPKDKDIAEARETLRKLIGDPIAKHLPPGTKTIFIAADGDLARLPWAALPIGKDRVLLEDYEVAVVPHGMFLLEQLKFPRKFEGPDSALVLGGVEYKSKVWPELPGTLSEMNEIVKLAPSERDAASGLTATTDRVSNGLAKVRYAHIATHGYFDADGFAAEKKREELGMKHRQFGDETRRVASKNPLGYVGLVLSNGKVISGLSILDLKLENLKLVTLSACETGLGEYTGGKGVENLQLAFHVAGAQNVIASLWKVNDAATAALMAKFYHELWVNKLSPLAALREAQLFIYYNPDKIPDVLGERGAPKRSEALAVKGANPQAGKRADTKLWAAFVLSGVGK